MTYASVTYASLGSWFKKVKLLSPIWGVLLRSYSFAVLLLYYISYYIYCDMEFRLLVCM